MKKYIRGQYSHKIINRLYNAIQNLYAIEDEYITVYLEELNSDRTWGCQRETNRLLNKDVTKEQIEEHFNNFYDENDKVTFTIYYSLSNKDINYMKGGDIGDYVVFPTKALDDKLIAYGKIIDKKDSQYKIDVIDLRGFCWNSGNKNSRDTKYRWVESYKIFKASYFDMETKYEDLKVGDIVLTNINNKPIITRITSIKKTIRTNINTIITDGAFYKLKLWRDI